MFDLAVVKAFLEVTGPWGLCGALLLVSIWKDKSAMEAISDRSRSTALLEAMRDKIKENTDAINDLRNNIPRGR